MSAVSILASGMVTGVGFDAASSCAAMRVGITGFLETRFMFDGAWLIGCPVPFDTPWRGREKLLQMVAPAIRECLHAARPDLVPYVPLLLCVAERDRPGRFEGLDESLLDEAATRLGVRLHPESALIESGRIGGLEALDRARGLVSRGVPACVIAGVDSFLLGTTLIELEKQNRLLTASNSDGFIPGEAAGAVLVGSPADPQSSALVCRGIGYGAERAAIEAGEPLRGEGLAQAFRAALADAACTWPELDFQIAALSGEQYGFKETALAVAKTVRPVKHGFDLWHPADCIGEVGAAIFPCMLGVALAATRKGYAPGPGVLCHVGNDDGQRGAAALRWESGIGR